jgi:hypothetical protein
MSGPGYININYYFGSQVYLSRQKERAKTNGYQI